MRGQRWPTKVRRSNRDYGVGNVLAEPCGGVVGVPRSAQWMPGRLIHGVCVVGACVAIAVGDGDAEVGDGVVTRARCVGRGASTSPLLLRLCSKRTKSAAAAATTSAAVTIASTGTPRR